MATVPAPTPVDLVDPLDLPILDEVPELGAALAAARRIDREVALLVDGLMRLQDHDIAEQVTGVALEQWLAIATGRTHADRRMLLTTCDVLRRLPSLRYAFLSAASVSWAQMRSIVLQVCRLPHHLDERIDLELARAIRDTTGADPDVLPRTVAWTLASLDPRTGTDVPASTPAPFFGMQPRLDGTGGRVWGEFDGHGFAVLDAALNNPDDHGPEHHDNPGPHAPGSPDDPALDGHGETGATTPGAPAPRRWNRAGERRARRLIDLLDHDHDTGHASRPTLLVRINIDDLLDPGRIPATLLTRLTGGRMWVGAATARRIADERGADLRTIVLDDTGNVVGIGRKSRAVPGWLRDTTLAIHDTCTAPGCQAAARGSDTDHAHPWWPTHPEDHPGRTDIDNLAPLCAHHNRTKEPDGWQATQDPDGSRRWHHQRTGLTTRTVPATLDLVRATTPPREHVGTDARAGPMRTDADTLDMPGVPDARHVARRTRQISAVRARAGPSSDDGLPF